MPRETVNPPLILPVDAALLATESVHAVLARALGSETGDQLAGRLARFATRVRPRKRKMLEALYRDMIGGAGGMPPADQYITDLIETLLQQRMLYARLGADKNWRPSVLEVEGIEAVEAARAVGRGVVLWLLPLEMSALLVRMVCADRGWPLNFISHWSHGPSKSWIGRSFVNARDCRIEEQFGPRLVMTDTDTGSALANARQVLGDGGLVGFRGIGWSTRSVAYPIFAGKMHLAFGAPATARKTGAALFVVSASRVAGGFRVGFTAMENPTARDFEEIGAEFAAHLQAAAKASPSLWSAKSRQWGPEGPGAGHGNLPPG